MLLSENLHLDVIAEGVETEAQLDLLRNLGCRQVQGFFLGIPRPAREIPMSQPQEESSAQGKSSDGLEVAL